MTPASQEYEFGGSAEQRIEKLIHYATRQGMTISAHGGELADIRRLLKELQDDRQEREVLDGRRDERDLAVLARMASMEKSIDGLKGVLNKAIAVIASAMALALLNWMLGGGMKAVGAALASTGAAT